MGLCILFSFYFQTKIIKLVANDEFSYHQMTATHPFATKTSYVELILLSLNDVSEEILPEKKTIPLKDKESTQLMVC